MGIVNSLKKKISQSIDNVRDTREQHRQEVESKQEALKFYTIKDMKDVCNQYGVGQPPEYHTDIISGKKIKNKMDRDEYVNFIVKKIPIQYILSYADGHRIRVPMEARPINTNKTESSHSPAPQRIPEVPSDPNPIRTELEDKSSFEVILNYIRKHFSNDTRDQFFRNEDGFNTALVSSLRSAFRSTFDIQDRRAKRDGSGDIVINGKYVLELKYVNNRSTMNNGFKEIKTYKQRYERICMVLLDVGEIQGLAQEYERDYRDEGVEVITLQGNSRR